MVSSVLAPEETQWELSVSEILKWKNYYLYFYFYEDMTFTDFIDLVQKGQAPKREIVDWDKVGYIGKEEIFASSIQ